MRTHGLQKPSRIFVIGPALLLLTLILAPTPAQAQTSKYWVGTYNTFWNGGANWNPTGMPMALDNVYLTQSDAIDRKVDLVVDTPFLGSVTIDATGSGSMTLNADAAAMLAAQRMTIGDIGIGSYVQRRGYTSIMTNGSGASLTLGNQAGSSGYFDLQSGYLYLGTAVYGGQYGYIGNYGSGGFGQSGGTHELNGAIYLGVQTSGVGSYYMANGTLTTAGSGYIALGNYGEGTFYQAGGSVALSRLDVGEKVGGRGYYTLSGGTLSFGTETIGVEGIGTFDQQGGVHTAGSLIVGGWNSATYNLSGGTLNSSATIGYSATGVFNHSGGTHHVTGDLVLGTNYAANGTYNLTGDPTISILQVSGNTIVGSLMGFGSFTQTGGTHNVHGILTVAANPGSRGTYNLSGGTLTALGGIVNNGKFNFSGGTLNANITNNAAGTLEISGGEILKVNGEVNSWGVIKVTGPGTKVEYTGTANIYGPDISDPATQHFTVLNIFPTGYLQGGDGDQFYISGDFLNGSTQDGLWDTRFADLFFTGVGTHNYGLAGFAAGNTWDEVSLLDGATLDLSGDTGSTLSLRVLNGDLSNIINTGLYPLTINISGAESILPPAEQSVPEPTTLLPFIFSALLLLRRRR
jgi:hypothetical protein